MYLRTPKRYQPKRRRRHLRLVSRRTLIMLMIIGLGVVVGKFVWENQSQVRSSVLPEIEGFASNVQTQVAPKPTPTETPDLEIAQSACTNAYRQGDLAQAIEQCAILADNNPNDVDLHYRVAHLLVITSNFGRDTQQLDRAMAFADKTINAAPESPYGWAIRAMVLDWGGFYGKALASALHAKALDDTFAPTYTFLGEIYYDLGDNETAMQYLDQALQLDTSGLAVADTFRTQGLVYSALPGEREQAIQAYETALQQAPNRSYIAIELALNYIALGEGDKAVQVLAAALEQNPTDTSVLFYLANAQLNNGNRERAYDYYRRCLDVDPNNVLCLSWLGGLQFTDGNYVTAITNLERAIELGSTDPDDFLQAGRAYTAQGNCTSALPLLRQGYQMVLDNEDFDKQTSFVNALQSCGQVITAPETANDAVLPEATEEVSTE